MPRRKTSWAPPTPDMVSAEIAKLKEMKPGIPARTGFGDDNHAAVEAQIVVLEKRLDENAIYEKFYPIDEETGDPDDSGNDQHAFDNAMDARRWLDGQSKESPSQEWQPICRTS